ncbi:YeeE/YedE family protein [Lysobacter arvi]|uniref:YeeE/YedE family protein n=1 Tax=Lysobacter arvi TaxID=3038776 RepID=A0ABU1CEM9_9GAMM|nr:YeeE/YedE family protein [Lysobacter arvi]MDR0182872.1 YeeE/YedE family protein [Lysobacter arvi]
MKRVVHAVVAGALFGLGLAVSGMTNPDKVLNFLDVAGHWDPSLALVMGAALAVAIPGFAWLRRRGCTLDGTGLPAPPGTRIDARLLLGSALFGIGWGIAGYCPGPALASLAHGGADAGVFVVAMLAGSQVARFFDAGKREARDARRNAPSSR